LIYHGVNDTQIYKDLSREDNSYWFDLKRQKFVHNIDTFYYSVKLDADFKNDSCDPRVMEFRQYFKNQFEKMALFEDTFVADKLPKDLILKKSGFAGMYNVHISKPDLYDFFFALTVPSDTTTEIVVQLRSYHLWLYGVKESYDRSFAKLEEVLNIFGFRAIEVKENRCDYAWHTNYIQDPDVFLRPDNIARMRVSSLGHDGDIHLEFKGKQGIEIDYFRFGRLKSNNMIFRIYLKSKEVVEQGYKSFFFRLWLIQGLINRYDLYVYEECYKRQDWGYMNKARLKFYMEFGKDKALENVINEYLNEDAELNYDDLEALANRLTPKVTLILNLEYQTMRKFSASIQFINFKNRQGLHKRIYQYLDNRKLIIDYLTETVFRLVNYTGIESNKSRCDYTPFWKRLRATRLVDTYLNIHDCKLVREYSNNIDMQITKNKVLSGLVTCSLYKNGAESDANVSDDILDFVCTLNDNDIQRFKNNKKKRVKQLGSKLDGISPVKLQQNFMIIDRETGEILE
jgi:hypothetical protein